MLKECRSQEEFEAKYSELTIKPMIDMISQSHPEFNLPGFNPKDFSSNNEDFGKDFIQRFIGSITSSNSEHSKTHQIVKDIAPILVNQIFDDWEKLRIIVPRYLTALQHRWAKRTVEKRKKVLLDAWPGMSPGHRPDFHALRHGLKGPEHRDAWMMPHINLEDLSKPINLLLLLETRASEYPEYFAWSDSAPSQMANASKAVRVLEAYGHTMLLSGEKTRNNYGSLVAWQDDQASIWNNYLGFGYHLGEGMNILETQKRLYRFLLRCTELLLPDRDLSLSALNVRMGETHQNVAINGVPREADGSGWISNCEANTEAAYRKPQQFALDRLRKLAAAKRDEAEDEFWILRGDPSYFRDAIEEKHVHLRGLDRVFSRNASTQVRPDIQEESLNEACRCVVLDACRYLVFWNIILADLEKLEELNLSSGVRSMQPLPKDYGQALSDFTVTEHMINDEV